MNFLNPKTVADYLGVEESLVDIKHPELSSKICFLWGSQDCLDKLTECVSYDYTARGTRQGFEFDVINELQSLLMVHLEMYPTIQNSWSLSKSDIW